MKRLLCLLLIITLFISSDLVLRAANASVISGTISSDTVWSTENNPYVLTGTVIVPVDVTLTIQPGVTVNFGSSYLQISGTLNARGTSDNNIVFTTNGSSLYSNQRIDFTTKSSSWDEQAGSGCIIENAVFSGVSLIINASPKINNNNFIYNGPIYNPISINGGSPLITNNILNKTSGGISAFGGSPVISNNSIIGNLTQTGILTQTNAYISNNNISNCYVGIYAYGNTTIQNNLITNNYEGIVSSGNLIIQNNLIAGNYLGIIGIGGSIQSNTITSNSIGITPTTPTSINNNNIFGNVQNNVALSNNVNVDLTNNWWGTTDIQVINQTILDSKIISTLGTVSFIPFLTAPNPSSPSMQNIVLGPIPVLAHYLYPNPVPSSTPQPTIIPELTPAPSPTPKSTPKPNNALADTITQLDIVAIAKIILLVLAVAWILVIVAYVDRQFANKGRSNP